MSIDKLQTRIRKLKNPSVVDLGLLPEHIPPRLMQQCSGFAAAYQEFSQQILDALKDIVPAVRFNMGAFGLYGLDGMLLLSQLLRYASDKGYYVFLDIPDARSLLDAQRGAQYLFDNSSTLCYDGLICTAYIGSDALRPCTDAMLNNDKDIFVLVRSSNKSAQELQDLLTGSRLVHLAAADIANRFAQNFTSRCGYSRVAVVAAAAAPDGLRNLRSKYKSLFLLLDGYDYPNANAKNCSYAFDRLGHGAAACAGLSVIAAWQQWPDGEEGYITAAVDAAERMRRNLTRYVSVL